MLPSMIGRYEVLGQLAAGGMAEILLARLSGPGDFRRAVVIKRVLRSYVTNASFVRMFLHEARIVASLRHPNIVHVQELGEHEHEPFLVMEYVAGENASSLLKRTVVSGEPLDPLLAAHIAAETCAGLHVAHELRDDDGLAQKLVHRDVSPQNVLVSYDGHVKLVDFGVALVERQPSLTEPGELKGKLAYMSPEQGRGLSLDRRSDLFSLGIVLYELSTGRRLFQRGSAAACIDAICREPIVPPSRVVAGAYPSSLEKVVMRALAKDPAARYQTAAEMRRDLLEVAHELRNPVELLAERMRRLFPDRISEKEELLRKVCAGEGLTSIPSGETDETVEVPGVTEATVRDPEPLVIPARAPPRLKAAVMTGFGAFVVACAGIVAVRGRAKVPDAIPSEPALSVPGASPSASAAPSAEAVLLRLDSRPPGARVVVEGRDRGATPLELSVPRAAQRIAVAWSLEGYETATQQIVPDSDQKVFVGLLPAAVRPKVTTAKPAKAPHPASTSSSFRRFD